MKTNLWERLLPQAREAIMSKERQYPAITEVTVLHLKDNKYHGWTELPYYIVKFMHEFVFGGGALDDIEEEEIRSLFEAYYEQ